MIDTNYKPKEEFVCDNLKPFNNWKQQQQKDDKINWGKQQTSTFHIGFLPQRSQDSCTSFLFKLS